MVAKMIASLQHVATVAEIEKIDEPSAKIANLSYLKELKKHITVGEKSVVIDKLPLNILHLPMINQIFPNAKFILALRHPLDCVLSCWMQDFDLNPAMANMVDLDRIVDFYDTTMSILKLSNERYALNLHKIRYEDLVMDVQKNVSTLLSFLDLRWEQGLLNYQKTALAEQAIHTPSYSQVVEPIYKALPFVGNIRGILRHMYRD